VSPFGDQESSQENRHRQTQACIIHPAKFQYTPRLNIFGCRNFSGHGKNGTVALPKAVA
jgi:hypothetical protein